MAPSTRTSPWRRPRCASRPPPVAGTFPRRATNPRGFARRALRRRSAGDATHSAPRSGREAPRPCGSTEAASCPSTRSTPPCRRRRCVAQTAQIAAPSFLCNNRSLPESEHARGGHGPRIAHPGARPAPGLSPPPNAAREIPRPRTCLTELDPPTHALPLPLGVRFPWFETTTRNATRSIGKRRSFQRTPSSVESKRRVFSILPMIATRAESGLWGS